MRKRFNKIVRLSNTRLAFNIHLFDMITFAMRYLFRSECLQSRERTKHGCIQDQSICSMMTFEWFLQLPNSVRIYIVCYADENFWIRTTTSATAIFVVIVARVCAQLHDCFGEIESVTMATYTKVWRYAWNNSYITLNVTQRTLQLIVSRLHLTSRRFHERFPSTGSTENWI